MPTLFERFTYSWRAINPALMKSDPTPGDVHVATPVWPKRKKKPLPPVEKGAPVEKRLVTGWASVITEPDGRPVIDRQGDVIYEDDLVEAAHGFMKHSRRGGDMHVRVEGIGTVVDSLVVTSDVKKALGLPSTFPTGWLITVHVDDDSAWQRVKSGELMGFSIGGTGVREQVVVKLAKGPPAKAEPAPLALGQVLKGDDGSQYRITELFGPRAVLLPAD